MNEKNDHTRDDYYSLFKSMLSLSNLIPGLTINQSEEHLYVHLALDEGPCDIHIMPVFTGLTLFCFNYHFSSFSYETFLSGLEKSYPEKIASIKSQMLSNQERHDIIKFNYCHCGRTELLTGNDVYVYMKENEFCIDKSPVTKQCVFPQGYYLGFALFMETNFPSLNLDIAKLFGIDTDMLSHKYLNKINQFTYITRCNSETLTLCEQIFHLSFNYKKQDIYKLRALILQLITTYQFAEETKPIGSRTFLTNFQIGIAKNVAKRIREDLSKRTSAKEMALDYGVSETSLKNYFREVYGENLSVYENRLRMEKAAELLRDTNLCVSAIAEQAGYLSQSKFAAAFKKYYQVTPVEFRRKSTLSVPD